MIKKHKTLKEFQPGRGYTKKDWDDVDSPELDAEKLKKARPFKKAFPELAKTIKAEIAKRGRPLKDKDEAKIQVTLRLDPDVIKRYKKTGRGWQSRINADLRKVSGL